MRERHYDILVEPGKDNKVVKGWTRKVPIDTATINQLAQMSKMPFIFPYIAVMPDAHAGKGSCVGSVIPTKDAVMPAAVGVDIGCGMIAQKLNVKREAFNELEQEVWTTIMRTVPTGRTDHGGDRDIGGWQGFPHNRGNIPGRVFDRWESELAPGYSQIMSWYNKPLQKARTYHHLGTLGTGNHFIELAEDENQDVWIIVHSGSRGIGNKIGSFFIQLAQEDCKRWFVDLPSPDLAFFPKGTERFDHYWFGLQWAQKYAWTNRELMAFYTLDAVKRTFGDKGIKVVDEVHCHHNYAERENHFKQNVLVTRKGAVRARKGDRGIIPGSMGERSFIVRGKQDKDALHSCSHGAGRVMSRAQARNSISVEDHRSDTEGVFCDKTSAVIDESPKAYKNIDDVMESQKDLVDIEHTLKGFINVKGVGDNARRRKKK